MASAVSDINTTPSHNHLNDDVSSTKSLNDRPKGILKQSPLHSSSVNGGSEYLSKQEKFAKSKLRVSINLPDNEISLGRSRRFAFNGDDRGEWEKVVRSNRAVVDVLRELDADVLALQDVKAEEEREMKPLSELAAALGMHYVFA